MDAQTLRNITRDYWKRSGNDDQIRFYLKQARHNFSDLDQSLLELEMDYAQVRSCLPEMMSDTTLVILVGDSFEPLLQSIWAHKPQKLVPVVNTKYGDKTGKFSQAGTARWGHLREWIDALCEKRYAPGDPFDAPETIEMVEDTPEAVFAYLRDKLGSSLARPSTHVVIDITGAKKTMVSGAFLFAAYSQATINYIDVEEYEEEGRGRPFGFSCCFKSVDNPIRTLYLQNWDRARQHYERHDFAGAIAAAPEKLELYEKELANLRRFLAVCQFWSDGQLFDAHQEYKQLPESLALSTPRAVISLGPLWPEPGQKTLKTEFFKNPENTLLYINDELHRIDRLHKNESYRAAFTRAYALHETMLKAMAVALYENGEYLTVYLDSKQVDYRNEEEALYETGLIQLVNTPAAHIRALLKGTGCIKLERNPDNSTHTYNLAAKSSYPLDTDAFFAGKDLSNIRNHITHTYFPATDAFVRDIVQLVSKTLEEYKARWAILHRPLATQSSSQGNTWDNSPYYSVPDWEQLMKTLGLAHFITPQDVKGANP